MRVISRSRLVQFWSREPRARIALAHWYKITKTARWKNIFEVRRTFGHADSVKVGSGNSVIVFNVGGNKYRLIAAVHYDRGRVFVLRVLTHAEYDAGAWKEEL